MDISQYLALMCVVTVMPNVCSSGLQTEYDEIHMVVRDKVHVEHPGQSLYLVCEFYMDMFDMFQNPIVWKKIQLHEITPINILGNVMPPFVDSGRFSLNFADTSPKYRVVLSITELTLEDYGNYTCEVRGPETTILGYMTHYVYIRAPVHTISISDSKQTVHYTDEERTLTFEDNSQISLYCKSLGGCPPPETSLYLGKKDITSVFHMETYAKLTGVRGLRLIEHVTESWTEGFHITADNDDQRLQCILTVPGLGSNISTIKIRVIYAPIISCEKSHASLGQANASLICDVRSRPAITALYWNIDRNGTKVSPGHIRNAYWTLNRARSDGKLETRLYIKRVTLDSFRTYTVVAENNIGTTTYEIPILQKYQHSSHQSVLQYPDENTSHSPHFRFASSASTIHRTLFWRIQAWTPLALIISGHITSYT